MTSSRISELSSLIAEDTARVKDYLRAHHLPLPSFDVDGPVNLNLLEEIEAARMAAIDALQELNDLLKGSVALIRPVVSPMSLVLVIDTTIHMNATSLQDIYRYDMAAKVPIHEDISFGRLAEPCDLEEMEVRRIVGFAIVWHRCFCEPRKGYVAHSAASRTLVDDPLVNDGLGLIFD